MIIGAVTSAMLGNMGSGSEGGFAESESPVVLASSPPEMEMAAASSDGENVSASWDDGAAAPDLESLRRLLATRVAQVGRTDSEKFTLVSIYLSSFESSSTNSQY